MRIGAAILALQLALVLGGCTSRHAYPDPLPDAGVSHDAAEDAQPDAGWPPRGARVTWTEFARPAALHLPCGDFQPCPYRMDTKLVLRARPVANGLEVRCGLVASVTDGGVGIAFADRLTPTTVFATAGDSYEADAGQRRPFVTAAAVAWDFDTVPDQPSLHVRNAVISGSLDAEGVPVSADPGMIGKVEGCFTQQDAEAVYITLLGETVEQLIEANGGQVDVDCTGSGALDGYTTEVRFMAEPVTLDE